MPPSPVRLRVVEAGALLVLAVLVARAGQVQLLQGRRWAAEAQAQRTERIVLPARRGALLTRDGTAVAVTQETYHVGVAPNELRAPARDAARIARALRVSEREMARQLGRRYAYFRGPYSAVAVEPLRAIRGVHLEPVLHRFYPSPGFARAVIGRVDDEGRGASGLERVLDSLLAGRPAPAPARPWCSRIAPGGSTRRLPGSSRSRSAVTTWSSPWTPSSRRSPSGRWTRPSSGSTRRAGTW